MTIRGTLAFTGGLAVSLCLGWVALPYALYQKRPQPVDFSHKVHTGEKAGLKCEDCHALREDGAFTGIPVLEKCTACHAAALGTTAAEKQFMERYATPVKEVAWSRYAQQPDNVYFPHAPHVKAGKLKCEQCHGAHGTTDTLKVAQQNRITGYSRATMTMEACEKCHADLKAQGKTQHQHSCLDCHK